jgi:hypothetical protein
MRGVALFLLLALASFSFADDPEDFLIPKNFVRYNSAKYTQKIAITNGQFSIDPVPRTKLEEKWQVPGGLVGITGWKSELYQAPLTRMVGVAPITVTNGFFVHANYGYGWVKTDTPVTQTLRGWTRTYADGQKFIDVLRNSKSGKVFEVREAEKREGRWHRAVTYRDRGERPSGYKVVSINLCAGCHSQAGSGGYNDGLKPGGDNILSDSFPVLEKQGK